MKKNGNSFKLEIVNQVKNVAEIKLYGDISPWDINASMVSDLLKSLDASVTEIDLRLFSGGGDVFEGIAIYNNLKRSDKKINVYVDGLAASIASVIMLAGDNIVMGEGSQVMIHLPWSVALGDKMEMQNTIDRLEMVEREIVKIYQRATGLSEVEITDMMTKETWFNDEKAIEFGFASEKVANETQFSIAASIKNCDWIKKKQLAKANVEFKNKISDNISKFSDVLARN